MNIYAIGDLHLSFSAEKAMDIFGGRWIDHTQRLKENWENIVDESDVVIVAGDISWGMKFKEAIIDLDWISELPGKKVMIKGNHDLWWSSINKMNRMYNNIHFLQNDYYKAGDFAICGTRGWIGPWDQGFTKQDEKVYKRELIRLRMSLEKAVEAGESNIIGALHYPPFEDRNDSTEFTDILEEYKVKQVVYGHLHGRESHFNAIQGTIRGINYNLVSCDYLDCYPLLLY